MILTKTINFSLNQFNYHHFKRIGYDVEGKDSIEVRLEDIGKGTMVKIEAKCDICGRNKTIGYRKYWKNYNKYGIYSCSNKCSMFKNRKSNLEKYGVEHQCLNKDVKENILKTKLKKGLISNDYVNFHDYRRLVNNLTKRNKKILLDNWEGYDYYDGEYIKDNFNLNYNHNSYPSIDHKISVLFGFENCIKPEEISDLSNLCITKRSTNSSKNSLSEKEFKEKNQS